MNEKEHSNVFRFSLKQGDVLLGEKMFNADDFNPFTRYSIDIRDILPKAITKLQKGLSKRSYDTNVSVGRNILDDEVSYELKEYNDTKISSYPKEYHEDMKYDPIPVVRRIGEKVIRGVECKIGLYINDNPIVERQFYVDGFNPTAQMSFDLTDIIIDITDAISEKIKLSDVKNMWDDYDLIDHMGLSINQIRELNPHKRGEMLRRIKRK